jgi:uncharacterized membrane protein
MDSEGSSFFSRAVAIVVLVVVAVVALRLVVGFVAGILSTLLWIVTLVALVVAFLWARRTLKSGKRERRVEQSGSREVTAAPGEDPVAVEMRKITEQLREQGRR